MRFVRIFRYDPVKDPTARTRLDYDPDFGNAILSDENVLPEQADNPDPHHVNVLATMQLTTACVRWLATQLTELADLMEKDLAEADERVLQRRGLDPK